VQWAHGYNIQFGLYAWSPGDGAKREERAATPLLAGIYKELPLKMRRYRKHALDQKPAQKETAMQGSPQSVLDLRPQRSADDLV
jgi:hypothetical protein